MRTDDISDQKNERERQPYNGFVFPSQACGSDGLPYREAEPGISMRDWFAGKALAGLCALPCAVDPEKDARLAYKLADAMLRERERG